MARRRLSVLSVGAIVAALGANGCGQLLDIQDRTAIGDGDASTGSSQKPTTQPEADIEEAASANVRVTSPSDAQGAAETSLVPDARAAVPEASVPDAAACPDPCDMADGLNEPFAMTSDAYNVYWVDFGDAAGAGNGMLKSCAVGGCSTPAVWQSGLMDPRGVVVDATNVYWGTTWGGVAGAMGAIWSCGVSLGAGGCATPAKLATTLDPTSLSVDASHVYWLDSNLNSVQRVRSNGTGAAEVLYAPPDGGLGVFLDGPSVCAVDASNLYIVDRSDNAYYLPKTGGTPVLLQKSTTAVIAGLSVDGTGNAYFSQSGRIVRGSATTSGIIPLVVNGSGISIIQPVAIAIDVTAQMLYWADFGSGTANDGAIGRSSLLGSNPALLQSKLTTPTAVTVSGNYTYWLSAGTLLSSTSTTTSYVQTSSGKLWRTRK